MQSAQTSAGAACSTEAAIGTAAEGICTQRAGAAGERGSPQGAVAIIMPQSGQGEVLVTSPLPDREVNMDTCRRAVTLEVVPRHLLECKVNMDTFNSTKSLKSKGTFICVCSNCV